jgi:hypothetical protein
VAVNPTTFTGTQWGAKRLPGTVFQGPAEDKSQFSITSYQPIISTRQFEEAKQVWETANDTGYASPVRGEVHDASGGQRFWGAVLDINNRVVLEIDQPYVASAAMHKAADNSVMFPGFQYVTTILSEVQWGPQDMRKFKSKTIPPYFAHCTRQLIGQPVSSRAVHTDNLVKAIDTPNDVTMLVFDTAHLCTIQSDPATWENPYCITPNNPALSSTNDALMFHRVATEHIALLRAGLQAGKMKNTMAEQTRQLLARLDQDKATKKLNFLVIDDPRMTGAWSQRLSAAFELQKREKNLHRPAQPWMLAQAQIFDGTDCLPQEFLHPDVDLNHFIHYQHLHNQPYMAKAYRALANYAMVSGKALWLNSTCKDTAFLLLL